jgi:cation diffusion facilitator CzcD-associated flavoprotein CzcO
VSAVGQLNRPRIPAFPGLESFAGPAFHSARWDRAFDPAGRTVAVVGSGASAVQFLPEIASAARRTLLFQRSPNWIHPLSDHAYSAARRWAHVHVPGLARLYRAGLFLSFESRYLAFRKESLASRIYTAWLRRRMRRLVPPALHAAVIPDYPAGCKRILLSNDYLETLRRDDVELVRDPIERVAPEGLVAGGRTHPADAIVFATGFETSRFLAPLRIAGRGGVLLEEAWRDRPRTCLGMLAAGFPNLFLLYGPNTNLGHNSIVFMVECQVEALLRCLQAAIARRAAEIEGPAALVDRCDRDLQERLRRTVWDGDCASWYRGSDGAITANWSSTATAYWWRTRRLDPDLLLRPSSNGRGTD